MTEILCITCPTGCTLSAGFDADGSLNVTGNGCKRGADFARAELTNPTRSLTTTVRTTFAAAPVLPVRTDGEIPKGAIPAAMRQLAGVVVDAPLPCGATVVADLCGTGVSVIATSNLLMEL